MKVKLIKMVLAFGSMFVFNIQAMEKPPQNIQWQTNNTAPVFCSSKAKIGGTFQSFIPSFPLTVRQYGPDSNSSFRSYLDDNQLSLLHGPNHPNTDELLPELATHWAFADDNKTMYFKLDKRARWSDGEPLTADDFVFAMEFMRSKNIISPWHNNFFTEEIDKVIKYDDHTLAIISKKPHPEVDQITNSLPPIPKHFYKGKIPKDFVRRYNWAIVPNTGPYQISKIIKGKSITFKRKKNWWAKDLRYFKNCFNVDKVVFEVIRDYTTAFEYFKKGKLDAFILNLPTYWHQKAKDLEAYDKGYIKKIWFYTNGHEPALGFWLNQDIEIFKDKNVRYAFGHAINMDKLIRELLRGDYSRLHGGTTGYGEYDNLDIKARNFSVLKVEELMKKSGWKRGTDGIWQKGLQRYSVRVTYSADFHTSRLVLLKEEAKKAGIELRLQRLDGSAAFKMVLEKKHEVYWGGWASTDRPQYWGLYHSVNAHKSQTNNITNTDDPEMDRLIDLYRKSLSINERIKLARKIQRKIHEIGAYVPTYYVGYIRGAYWRWWKFPDVPATKTSEELFEPFKLGMFWFDAEEKKRTKDAMKAGETFSPETIVDTTYKR